MGEHDLYCTPGRGEYNAYYEGYVQPTLGHDVLALLVQQLESTARFLRRFRDSSASRHPGPTEWCMTQVVGHLCDFERIFSYRITCISRGDQTPLPGFEQESYVEAGQFGARTLGSLGDELASLRRATILQLQGLPADAWTRTGVASGWPVSVRALASIIAGHEQGHLADLRRDYVL